MILVQTFRLASSPKACKARRYVILTTYVVFLSKFPQYADLGKGLYKITLQSVGGTANIRLLTCIGAAKQAFVLH